MNRDYEDAGVDEWTSGSVRALRLALRLSQEKFAQKLGASAKTVGNWERDLNRPGLDLKDALDSALVTLSHEQRKRFFHFSAEAARRGTPSSAAQQAPGSDARDVPPSLTTGGTGWAQSSPLTVKSSRDRHPSRGGSRRRGRASPTGPGPGLEV